MIVKKWPIKNTYSLTRILIVINENLMTKSVEFNDD
jgi:hypothetical protein